VFCAVGVLGQCVSDRHIARPCRFLVRLLIRSASQQENCSSSVLLLARHSSLENRLTVESEVCRSTDCGSTANSVMHEVCFGLYSLIRHSTNVRVSGEQERRAF
jgi:hypothetical protein